MLYSSCRSDQIRVCLFRYGLCPFRWISRPLPWPSGLDNHTVWNTKCHCKMQQASSPYSWCLRGEAAAVAHPAGEDLWSVKHPIYCTFPVWKTRCYTCQVLYLFNIGYHSLLLLLMWQIQIFQHEWVLGRLSFFWVKKWSSSKLTTAKEKLCTFYCYLLNYTLNKLKTLKP